MPRTTSDSSSSSSRNDVVEQPDRDVGRHGHSRTTRQTAGERKRKQDDRLSGEDEEEAAHSAAARAASVSTSTTGLTIDPTAAALGGERSTYGSTSSTTQRRGQGQGRQRGQHVTPSPAVASASASLSSKFAFETPPRKAARRSGGTGKKGILADLQDDDGEEEEQEDEPSQLPPGVVDMYAYTARDLHDFDNKSENCISMNEYHADLVHTRSSIPPTTKRSLRFDDAFIHSPMVRREVNSSNSLSAEFIRSYGEEYLQSLKDSESPAVPYPASPNSRTHLRGDGTTNNSGSRSGHGNRNGNGNELTSSQESSATGRSRSSRGSGTSGSSSYHEDSRGHHHGHHLSDGSSDSSFDDEDFETPPNRKSYIHPATQLKMDTTVSRMVKTTNKQHSPVESTDFLMYQPELTPKMRTILVDWLIELSDHFHFSEQTLHRAITLVDMVLSCGPLGDDKDEDARDYGEDDLEDDHDEYRGERDQGEDDGEDRESSRLTTCYYVSRNRFQLLGATCSWMACKLLEVTAPSLQEIAYVSDHIYTVRQIKRMERRVCNALEFRFMSQPTPYLFLHEFLRSGCGSEDVSTHPSCFYEMSLSESLAIASSSSHSTTTPNNVLTCMACYLLELGRMPYMPATRPPSLLAASAVYLARVTLGIRSTDRSKCSNGWWTPTLEYVTGYEKSQLVETVEEIYMYQSAAESSNLKAVYAKYKSRKHHRVALKTVPLRDDLGI